MKNNQRNYIMNAPNMAMNSKYGFAIMEQDELRIFKKITPRELKNIQSAVSSYATRHGVHMQTRSSTTKKGNLKLVVTRIA
jgi:hypothetical protein